MNWVNIDGDWDDDDDVVIENKESDERTFDGE